MPRNKIPPTGVFHRDDVRWYYCAEFDVLKPLAKEEGDSATYYGTRHYAMSIESHRAHHEISTLCVGSPFVVVSEHERPGPGRFESPPRPGSMTLLLCVVGRSYVTKNKYPHLRLLPGWWCVFPK